MKKGKLLLAAVALLLVLFIGGTAAYFTDTKTTTNTFTLGNVEITLTESNWVAANAAGIVPGQSIDKNPVIQNTGASPAFVFIKIDEPCYNNSKIFSYTPDSAWTLVNGGTCAASTGVSTASTVYAYGTSSAMTSLAVNASTSALFTQVTLDSTLDSAAVTALGTGNQNIVVTAYGIQAEGLSATTPSAVWTTYTTQNP